MGTETEKSLLIEETQEVVESCRATRSLWSEPWEELSYRIDRSGLQDACAVRNILLIQNIAQALFNEEEKLDISSLEAMVEEGEENAFWLLPGWEIDAPRRRQILGVLTLLKEKEPFRKRIDRFSTPYQNPVAERLIRQTLSLPDEHAVTDVDTRQAALAAWMTYLRQNIGSCFATAPGILIQQEQPEQFLMDLQEMLETGKIKRVVAGQEYAFPMSMSWGVGDLRRPVLVGIGGGPTPAEIADSPSLLAAIREMGLFSDDEDETTVKKRVVSWIEEKVAQTKGVFVTLSAEEIFEGLLAQERGIGKKERDQLRKRQAAPVASGGLVLTPTETGKGKEKVLERFEKGKRVFQCFTECALLKTWEYTLASFAETKAKFTRWNLYSCLGFPPEDRGGLGEILMSTLRQKVDESNRQVEAMQAEYEQAYAQVKFLESRLKRASEDEARWLRAEYQTRVNEFQTLEEMRNQHHRKGQIFANLYNDLVEEYYELFPRYFQEVYDPDLHDVQVGPFDDSPAGFRLLFKHGRALTSQWSAIDSREEFVRSLVTFFSLTEQEVLSKEHLKPVEQEVASIITALIHHVQTDRFLETAFYRMAAAHKTPIKKDPLAHIDSIEIKPWAYTSGGTMGNLVGAYYRLDEEPVDRARWVEHDTELLVFLIDLLKEMPPTITDLFEKNPEKSLLMHSPTHAFLLKPGWRPFYDLWNHEAYTYTWLRDNYIYPGQRWLDDCHLGHDQMDFFLEEWKKRLPEELQTYFLRQARSLYRSMTPVEFRSHVQSVLENDRSLKKIGQAVLSGDVLDGSLYESLPLLRRDKLEKVFVELIDSLDLTAEEKTTINHRIKETVPSLPLPRILSARQWQSLLQEIVMNAFKTSTWKTNLPLDIVHVARKIGLLLPEPVLVADTNWMRDLFGFTVNPGTGVFEFWRFDQTLQLGRPMSHWRHWLDGSRQTPTWGVYTNPIQYTSSIGA